MTETNEMSIKEVNDMEKNEEDYKVPLLSSLKKKPKRGLKYQRLVLGVTLTIAAISLIFILASWYARSIANREIAATNIDIIEIHMGNPKLDSIDLSVILDISHVSPYSGTISSSKFFIIYNDSIVGAFISPEMLIESGVTNRRYINASTFSITNISSWNALAQNIIKKDAINWTMQATIDLETSLLGLSFNVKQLNFRKTIKLLGLKGLNNLEIIDLDMTTSTVTSVRTKVKACLYNPSFISIDPLGDLYFQVLYRNKFFMNLTSHSTRLNITKHDISHPACKRGINTLYGYNLIMLNGNISSHTNDLLSKYLSGISVQVLTQSQNPIATSFPIYNEAMQGLMIPTVIPGSSNPLFSDMVFRKIEIQPLANTTDSILLNASTAIKVFSPLGLNSPIYLSYISLCIKLYDESHTWLGQTQTVIHQVPSTPIISSTNIDLDIIGLLQVQSKSFSKFIYNSIRLKTVLMDIDGYINITTHGAIDPLYLNNLKIKFHFNLTAMNNLQNISIMNFTMPEDFPRGPGEVLRLSAQIWNPSNFAVQSEGKVHFDLLLQDETKIGSLEMKQLVILQRENKFNFLGRINPHVIDKNRTVDNSTNSFFSKYLRNEDSLVTVKVIKVENTSSWLSDAMVGLRLSTVFKGVGDNFNILSNLNAVQLNVSFEEDEAIYIQSNITAKVNLPPSLVFPLQIAQIKMNVTLQNGMGQTIGDLITRMEKCHYNQSTGFFEWNMQNRYHLEQLNLRGMANLVKDLFLKNETLMHLSSNIAQGASPELFSNMGRLLLSNLPINAAMKMIGMNSFLYPQIEITSMDILEGQKQQLHLELLIKLKNPSSISTNLGILTNLVVLFEEKEIAIASISRFSIVCCNSSSLLKSTVLFAPLEKTLGERFLSNFVSGYYDGAAGQKIRIQGHSNSTSIRVLKPTMQSLSLATIMYPLSTLYPKTPNLLLFATMYRPKLLHLKQIASSFALTNPFSEKIEVLEANFLLYPCKVVDTNNHLTCLSYYSTALANYAPSPYPNFIIPKHTKNCSPCCQSKDCKTQNLCIGGSNGTCPDAQVLNYFSFEAIEALLASMSGGLLMQINGSLRIKIGEYEAKLQYFQKNLMVKLST